MVLNTIRSQIHQEPTGRPAKSTNSIREKLNRESIRLNQIQDIAGCRIVVAGNHQQDEIVALFHAIFPDAVFIDRRFNPSYGYRAVHVVIRVNGKPIEVQIRTVLQHSWAELSEKLADVLDPSIKYGGGDEWVREFLLSVSDTVGKTENLQKMVVNLEKRIVELEEQPLGEQPRGMLGEVKVLLGEIKADENALWQRTNDLITETMRRIAHVIGQNG